MFVKGKKMKFRNHRFSIENSAGANRLSNRTRNDPALKIVDQDDQGILSYSYDLNLMMFQWLPATEQTSPGEFKDTMSILSDFVVEQQVRSLLIDVRELRFLPPPALRDWHAKVVVPKYNQSLHRHGWITHEYFVQLPSAGQPYRGDGEEYLSRWFNHDVPAVTWTTFNVEERE